MAYSGHGSGTMDIEPSTPKVATMQALRKEANEYHDPDWKSSEGHSKNSPNQSPTPEAHYEKKKDKWWQIFLFIFWPLIAMIIILQM